MTSADFGETTASLIYLLSCSWPGPSCDCNQGFLMVRTVLSSPSRVYQRRWQLFLGIGPSHLVYWCRVAGTTRGWGLGRGDTGCQSTLGRTKLSVVRCRCSVWVEELNWVLMHVRGWLFTVAPGGPNRGKRWAISLMLTVCGGWFRDFGCWGLLGGGFSFCLWV